MFNWQQPWFAMVKERDFSFSREIKKLSRSTPCRKLRFTVSRHLNREVGEGWSIEISKKNKEIVDRQWIGYVPDFLDRTEQYRLSRWREDTSPRLPCSSRAPRSRTETLLLPKQACFHLHLRPIVLSVKTAGFDLTISWPPAKRDARLRHVLIVSTPYGNRTRTCGLKARHPQPSIRQSL